MAKDLNRRRGNGCPGCPFLEFLEHTLVKYFEVEKRYIEMRQLGVERPRDSNRMLKRANVIKKMIESLVAKTHCEVNFTPNQIKALKAGGY